MKKTIVILAVFFVIGLNACTKLKTPTEVPPPTPTAVMALYTDVATDTIKGIDAEGVTRTVNSSYEFYNASQRQSSGVFGAIVYENTDYKLGIIDIYAIFQPLTTTANGYNSLDYDLQAARIVYTSYTGSYYQLYTIRADASGNTQLTYNDTHKFQPSLSPDGQKVAFIEAQKPYFMNVNGSGKTELTIGAAYNAKSISWSPDGQYVALTVNDTGSSTDKVLTYKADNSQAAVLVTEGATSFGAVCWYDTATIYYDRQELSTVNIWKINPDSTGNTRVTYQGVGDYATLSYGLWD